MAWFGLWGELLVMKAQNLPPKIRMRGLRPPFLSITAALILDQFWTNQSMSEVETSLLDAADPVVSLAWLGLQFRLQKSGRDSGVNP